MSPMVSALLAVLGFLAVGVAPVALPGAIIVHRRRLAHERAVEQARPAGYRPAPGPRPPWWGLAGRERRTVRWLATAAATTHRRYDRIERRLSDELSDVEARMFLQLGVSREEWTAIREWARLKVDNVPILSASA